MEIERQMGEEGGGWRGEGDGRREEGYESMGHSVASDPAPEEEQREDSERGVTEVRSEVPPPANSSCREVQGVASPLLSGSLWGASEELPGAPETLQRPPKTTENRRKPKNKQKR